MGVAESIIELVGKSVSWTVTIFIASSIFLLLPVLTSSHYDPVPPGARWYVIVACVVCGTHVLVSALIFIFKKIPDRLYRLRQRMYRLNLSDIELLLLEHFGKKPTEVFDVETLTHPTFSQLEIVHACSSLMDKGYVHYDTFHDTVWLVDDGRAFLVERMKKKSVPNLSREN